MCMVYSNKYIYKGNLRKKKTHTQNHRIMPFYSACVCYHQRGICSELAPRDKCINFDNAHNITPRKCVYYYYCVCVCVALKYKRNLCFLHGKC